MYIMNKFYGPDGNLEVWEIPPEGYITVEQWQKLHHEISLPELKIRKKQEIATARYEEEISGIVFDGYQIATDRDSQSLITGAALAAMQDSSYSARWKTTTGSFINLNADQILTVAQAVRVHVQSCFDHEAELLPLIEAATTEAELNVVKWGD